MNAPRTLTRQALADSGGASGVPPVRIVHLGLGAFHRAHQAWYTAHAKDADEWGIAAFTGRTPEAARLLNTQECLYTLTTRSPEGDTVEVVPSLVEAHDASNVARLSELLGDPAVVIVTLTVTEAGYGALPGQDTVLRRLLHGLEARRNAEAGPIAIVPCDNMPNNGPFVGGRLQKLAQMIDPATAAWIGENVSFVSTSVDRITPRWDGHEIPAVGAAGWQDVAPVITEPFTDWVLEGEFPGGRPQWESAGATFVDAVQPYEQRKLWLLNGAHTALACAGRRRALETVAQAAAESECARLMGDFWDEALRHLPESVETERYRSDLLRRFANPRMQHYLSQIAMETTAKLGVRVAPVARLEREQGRSAEACARVLAEWIAGIDPLPPVDDARLADVSQAALAEQPVQALLEIIDAELASDTDFVAQVAHILKGLRA